MKFDKITINNFLGIGEIEANLADRGLVLIQGDNRDDSSQNSNGAGKSSVADAVCWCLYGVTARGLAGDSVVNETSGKNCLVQLNISEGESDEFVITRHRKHKTGKNRLSVSKDGIDLTKGTDKLTQELVNDIIGSSAEVFCAAVYAGQDNMPSLPELTDKFLEAVNRRSSGYRSPAKSLRCGKEASFRCNQNSRCSS